MAVSKATRIALRLKARTATKTLAASRRSAGKLGKGSGIRGAVRKVAGFVSDRQRKFFFAVIARAGKYGRAARKTIAKSEFGKGAAVKRASLKSRSAGALLSKTERARKVKLTRTQRVKRFAGATVVAGAHSITRPETLVSAALSPSSLRVLSAAILTGVITKSVTDAGGASKEQIRAEVRKALRRRVKTRLREMTQREVGGEGKRFRDLPAKTRRKILSRTRRKEARFYKNVNKAVDNVTGREKLRREERAKRSVGRPRAPRPLGRPKAKRPVGRPRGS
jgi:hypothetical protein